MADILNAVRECLTFPCEAVGGRRTNTGRFLLRNPFPSTRSDNAHPEDGQSPLCGQAWRFSPQ